MAKYEAIYLPSAQTDINNAVSYIAGTLLNPDAASRLLDAIDEKVNVLASGDWKGQSLKNHSSGLFTDIAMNWCAIKNYYLFFSFDETDMYLRIYFFSHKLQGLDHILKEPEYEV
jgi:plasmid stabilization system protein ParE